jgi:N-acetylmuramoyl-L-alanine amidase.
MDCFSLAPPDVPRNENLTLPNKRVIYLKKEWYGKPAKFERAQKHPIPFVVISHTVTDPCYTYTECASQMRSMQDVYMSGKFPDLGYNFVVGGDGNVYEARGWDVTSMHTGYVRYCNLGISLIGNFVQDIPTNAQSNATQDLIKLGVKLGKIDQNYKLVAMSDTGGGSTLSPGKNLYEIMEKWPHFWRPSEDDIGMCPFDVK